MPAMTKEKELQRLAEIINAQGFDPSREIEDLPYFVGEKEWKERHGDAVPDAANGASVAA
jgi:type IV secretory pathway TrbF-like protein